MIAPSRDRRLLFVISYHHACNDGALIAIVALLPILVDEMALTFTEIGILGLGLLITVVVQLIIGRLTDRAFSRYLLEVGAALMALSFVLVLFVSDFVGLFMAVISMRIGASFYHPVGISWITREYAGPYLDTALGIQSGIGNFGVIAALASSGFLGEAFGWKVPCIIWAILNLAAVAFGL
ncbi:MAG: MFS transporter, partial [Thermoplasmata archaeon]